MQYDKTASSVSGTVEISTNSSSQKTQVTVEGSAGTYTIRTKVPGSTAFRDITDGAVDGASGSTLLIDGRITALQITPPNGAEYNVIVNGLN